MKYKILGYIFIAAVLAAIVSVLYYQQVKNSVPENVILPVHKDVTADWKTYTNNKYGFELKYPKEHTVFTALNAQQNGFISATADSSKLTIAEDEKLAFCCEPNDLTVDVISSSLSLKDWIDKNAATYSDQAEIKSIININFAGKNAIQLNGGGNLGSMYKLTVLKNNDKIIVISQSFASILLDQILSTFKFTDSNPQAGKGILTGHADVGPMCPVERVGQSCTPSPEAYMARQVGVFIKDSSKLVVSQHLDANGDYKFDLPPGTYDVKASGMMVDQLTSFKGTVTIKASQTTTLDFSIDTGIR